MPQPSRNSAQALVDRIGAWQLVSFAIVLTVVPALLYYALSAKTSTDGLISPDPRTSVTLTDAIYFSVVTESTLGYGDIRPIGWSRLIAITQVISGLLFGGICIAKITSTQGRIFRLAYSYAGGDWIETLRTNEGLVMISFARIYLGARGLHYDGENFDQSGTPLGFFRGAAIQFDLPGGVVKFDYSTKDSSADHFTEGTSTNRFTSGTKTRKWIRRHSTTHDLATNQRIVFLGFRASPEEQSIIHGEDNAATIRLIKTYSKLAQVSN